MLEHVQGRSKGSTTNLDFLEKNLMQSEEEPYLK